MHNISATDIQVDNDDQSGTNRKQGVLLDPQALRPQGANWRRPKMWEAFLTLTSLTIGSQEAPTRSRQLAPRQEAGAFVRRMSAFLARIFKEQG